MEQAEKVAAVVAAWEAAYADYEAGGCSPDARDLIRDAAKAIGAATTPEGEEFLADVFYESDVWESDHKIRAAWVIAELEAE